MPTPHLLFGLIVCLVFAPRESAAEPLSIQLLNQQHRTRLAITYNQYTDDTFTEHHEIAQVRELTGAVPVHDSLMPWDASALAIATSDVFGIDAQTYGAYVPYDFAGGLFSYATAETILEFQPLTDGTAALTLDLVIGGSTPEYSSGLASIRNLTTGDTLWRVGWDRVHTGVGPNLYDVIGLPGFGTTTTLNFETVFHAADRYALTLLTSTDANFDSQHVGLSVSGLKSVPEPGTLLLLSTGLIGVGLRRWRRPSAHG